MSLYELISTIFVIAGALVVVFIYFQFSPVLKLKIEPIWVDNNQNILLVRFAVENKARVRISVPKIQIQILEYKIPVSGLITEWVPFNKNSIHTCEPPIEWKEPINVFTSTKQIYPGEKITIERLYKITSKSTILHIGLQVKIELKLINKIVTLKWKNWSQTTTCFAVRNFK